MARPSAICQGSGLCPGADRSTGIGFAGRIGERSLLNHWLIADPAFPLELKVPNAATRVAMAEAEDIAAKRLARFADLEEMVAAFEATDLETSGKE